MRATVATVPTDLREVDAAFLTAVLEGGFSGVVVNTTATPLGLGRVGASARVELEWHPAGAGPSSVVVKLSSSDRRARFTSKVLRIHEVESAFYATLADRLPVRTPACHLAAYDASTDRYCLVLEDIASGYVVPAVEGCSYEEAALGVEELARMHAASWGDPGLDELDWLDRGGGGFVGAPIPRLLEAVVPVFLERHGAAVSPAVTDAVRALHDGRDRYGAGEQMPSAVVHGDFRVDNLLFAGGEVVVLDWQTVARAPALTDVSYFLGTSLSVDHRHAYERDLLARYRGALAARGVAIGWDDCWQGYRRYALGGLVMAVVASTMLPRSAEASEMFALMAERATCLALDVGGC